MKWATSWFFWDGMIDIYFLIDLGLSFRTAFHTPDGELEYHGREIARNYFRHWFAIDFMSCLPFSYIGFLPSVKEAEEEEVVESEASATGKTNKLVRLLRLLRLLKLLRLARVNRIIARYEQEYYALVSSLKIFKVIAIVTLVGHWLCCAWFAAGSATSTFLNADGEPLQGWVERRFGGNATADGVTQYGVALYWSMMTMTTVGYGDIPPETEYEYWFVTVAMLLGGFVFGMIVGYLGHLSKDANPEEDVRMRTTSLLNAYVVRQEKNTDLLKRVRNFKAHNDSVQSAMNQMEMMRMLPWSERIELAQTMQWLDGFTTGSFRPGILHRVPFFQNISEMACISICAAMKHTHRHSAEVNPYTGDLRVSDFIFEEGDAGQVRPLRHRLWRRTTSLGREGGGVLACAGYIAPACMRMSGSSVLSQDFYVVIAGKVNLEQNSKEVRVPCNTALRLSDFHLLFSTPLRFPHVGGSAAAEHPCCTGCRARAWRQPYASRLPPPG